MTSAERGYQGPAYPPGYPPQGYTPAHWQTGGAPPPVQQPANDSGGLSLLAVAGLAALALGAWVVYSHGPDIQRYMKIRSM